MPLLIYLKEQCKFDTLADIDKPGGAYYLKVVDYLIYSQMK